MPGGREAAAERASGATLKPLTWRDHLFMDRMTNDVEDRRRNQFINELKKDPRFKPSMLEPPKPKFKEVSVGAGNGAARLGAHCEGGLQAIRTLASFPPQVYLP